MLVHYFKSIPFFQRDLVDFGVCGSGIWAVWGSSGSGERDVTVTASALGPTAQWRSCLSASLPSPELLPQTDHYAYLECLFRPGLFPIAVIAKALSVSVFFAIFQFFLFNLIELLILQFLDL